jgi:hypothetical protein
VGVESGGGMAVEEETVVDQVEEQVTRDLAEVWTGGWTNGLGSASQCHSSKAEDRQLTHPRNHLFESLFPSTTKVPPRPGRQSSKLQAQQKRERQ